MLDDILQINHILGVRLVFEQADGERRTVSTSICDEDMFLPVPEMDDREREYLKNANPDRDYKHTSLALFEPLAKMMEDAGLSLKEAHFECSRISIGIVLHNHPFDAKIVFGGEIDEGEMFDMSTYDVVDKCLYTVSELHSVLLDGRIIPILNAIRRDKTILKYRDTSKFLRSNGYAR